MPTIFLLDIDCFFASVEMALRPELKGRPLCIGGHKGERGIVACPNYEARAYGVKTAMPLRTAERLLPPDALFLPGNHRVYGEYSERVMNILYDFTPDVEQVSIDEAYLDVTGCLHFWKHNPVQMAQAIKDRIRNECGLSVSIGIASNKVCAKIAAGLKKPNGLVVVPHGGESVFLAPLPIEVVPGIGVKTAPKLHALGIRTVADILHSQSPILNPASHVPDPARPHTDQSMAGWRATDSHASFVRSGGPYHTSLFRYLTAVANGRDDRVMQYNKVEKSISRDTTFAHDTQDAGCIISTLYYLTERCCKTLRKRQQVASTITTRVRFADFTTIQKQTTLAARSAHEEDIFAAARRLLEMLLPPRRRIRLVGVKVSGLSSVAEAQLDMLKTERFERLHHRLDALQTKFGYTAIQWGITYALQQNYRSVDDGYELHSPVYGL